MIKGITPTGRYTLVSGGNSSNPYISPGAAGAGMIRWNPNMNCMKVNDGNMWKTIETNYASVGLTQEAESLLDWVRQKQDEEAKLQNLMNAHPGLKDAYEKFNLMKMLCDNETNTAR